MALVKVKYGATFEQTMHWPDDELGDLNYENLQTNLTPDEDSIQIDDFDIKAVKLNGEDHCF